MKITFTEESGLNKSVYGDSQLPIRMFLEEHGEEFGKDDILKKLFKFVPSDEFAMRISGMTAFEGFQPLGENAAYPRDGMQEGYHKDIFNDVQWMDSFSVSAMMIEDNKILDLTGRPTQFITGYNRTREKFGAALYGGALQGKSTITFRKHQFDIACNDGKPLFHKQHKPKVSGDMQSNICSNEFSADALGLVETHMQNFLGDTEEELDVAPDTILIPNDAELKKAVFAAIGADKEPTTNNNAYNYQYGRWNVIVWKYLNRFITPGSKPWILLDQSYNQTYAGGVWVDRLGLTINSWEDKNNSANVWNGRSRYKAAFSDWRFAMAGGIESADPLA